MVLDILHDACAQLLAVARACGEVDLHLGDIDILEQRCDSSGVALFHTESKRRDALAEHVESLGIGGDRIGGVNFLTGQPVVVGACATDKRIFAGKRIGCAEVFYILGTVHRLHIEALIGTPYQFLVERRAFQVGFHFLAPFGCCHRRKLVKQFFFFFCHDLVLGIKISLMSERPDAEASKRDVVTV